MSFLTQSHQACIGRPLCLIASTAHVTQRLTRSLSSFPTKTELEQWSLKRCVHVDIGRGEEFVRRSWRQHRGVHEHAVGSVHDVFCLCTGRGVLPTYCQVHWRRQSTHWTTDTRWLIHSDTTTDTTTTAGLLIYCYCHHHHHSWFLCKMPLSCRL